MTIRPACADDVPDLLRIGRDFYAASGSAERGLGYDEADLLLSIQEMEERGFFRVAEVGGRVVGAVGGLLGPWYLSRSQTMCHEVWWWVDHEHRGAAGLALLRAMEEWAEEQGAACVQVASPPSLTEGHTAGAVVRWFDALGYQWLESSWVRRLGNG